ncbi:MAG: Hpt domain-containing protein [Myxococcota bacterium]
MTKSPRDRALRDGSVDDASEPPSIRYVDAPAPAYEDGSVEHEAPEEETACLDTAVLESLRALAEGDDGFMEEVLGLFLEDTIPRLTAIREALARGDSAEAARVAHALKGSAANVGAIRLRDTAAAVEARAKADDAAGAAAVLDRADRDFEATRSALLRDWLPSPPGAQSDVP